MFNTNKPTQAARGKPVLARDWVIHPLQLVEAKEAGAAGVLGVIGQVNGRATAVMSSFGAALGLDCPVEVVNARVSKRACQTRSVVTDRQFAR